MLKQLSLTICIISALVLIGCSHAGTESNSNAAANANKAVTTSSPSTPTTKPTSTTAEKIGVPECDDFITKYEACVSSKVPEAARAQYKASIETWRSQWSKLAANPQTKASLAQACKTAHENARTTLKSFNCEL
jgi:PBP1b-binding outer membrane lipoprotein LpoB